MKLYNECDHGVKMNSVHSVSLSPFSLFYHPYVLSVTRNQHSDTHISWLWSYICAVTDTLPFLNIKKNPLSCLWEQTIPVKMIFQRVLQDIIDSTVITKPFSLPSSLHRHPLKCISCGFLLWSRQSALLPESTKPYHCCHVKISAP